MNNLSSKIDPFYLASIFQSCAFISNLNDLCLFVFFNAHEFIGKVISEFKQMFSKCKLKNILEICVFYLFNMGCKHSKRNHMVCGKCLKL